MDVLESSRPQFLDSVKARRLKLTFDLQPTRGSSQSMQGLDPVIENV